MLAVFETSVFFVRLYVTMLRHDVLIHVSLDYIGLQTLSIPARAKYAMVEGMGGLNS